MYWGSQDSVVGLDLWLVGGFWGIHKINRKIQTKRRKLVTHYIVKSRECRDKNGIVPFSFRLYSIGSIRANGAEVNEFFRPEKIHKSFPVWRCSSSSSSFFSYIYITKCVPLSFTHYRCLEIHWCIKRARATYNNPFVPIIEPIDIQRFHLFASGKLHSIFLVCDNDDIKSIEKSVQKRLARATNLCHREWECD